MNRIKKFATTLAVALSAASAALAFASPTSAAGWEYANRNNDGYYDAAAMDVNGDGIYEYLYIDTDFNTTWDVYVYATGNWTQYYLFASRATFWTYASGGVIYSYVDANADGRYERLTFDGNSDTVPEWHMVDTNGDGHYDGNWIQIVTNPAPVVSNTASNNATRLLLNQLMMDHNNRMVSIWLS